VTARADSLLK